MGRLDRVTLPPNIDSEDRRAAVLTEVWPELAAYVRRLLTREPHLVEDIMNNAAADFTLYWRNNGEVDRDRAAMILKRSAKCDVFDHWNKQQRRQTSPVAIDDQLLLDHAEPNSDKEILAALGRIDHERFLEKLHVLLTEREREVIVAIEVEQLTQQQAARQLGISVEGLRKMQARALNRLRQYLTAPPSTSTASTARTNREARR
jgi:RNA polymerase sigma factor (sigma-70 family)